MWYGVERKISVWFQDPSTFSRMNEMRVKLCKRMLMPFSQRPPGTCLQWNKVGCTDLLQQGRMYTLEKGHITEFGLLLGNLGNHTRKGSFSLLWMLSGSGGNSMTGQPHSSHLEAHKDGVRLKLWLVKTNQLSCIIQGRWCLVIFVVGTTFMFLSVYWHDYRMILFMPCLSGLAWYWCSLKLFIFNRKTAQPSSKWPKASSTPLPNPTNRAR